MDLQQGKWRKTIMVVVLLLLVIAGAEYVSSIPEPPVVLQKSAGQREKAGGPEEVKGLAAADNSSPLRNPFSLLHETESEALLEPPAPVAQAVTETRPAGGAAAQSSPSALPPQQTAGQDITLCGIADGAGGRLALLRVGNTTVAAAVGEAVQGWQVIAVGTAAAVVVRAGQERTLEITADREGAGGK